jgi:hypothetical protein
VAASRSPAQSQNRQGQGADQKAAVVPGDRASLARALQRELQRVGCYEGEVNGAWTTSTRMAMKAFTDRVNATLPIDAPDYILLNLVQRHEGKACGTHCPTGQLLSDEGRCAPSAVLTKAVPKPAGPGEGKDADSGGSGISSASSWSPTSGLAAAGAVAALAPEVRAPSTSRSGGLPGSRPDYAGVEPREDRSRAAARPDVDADAASGIAMPASAMPVPRTLPARPPGCRQRRAAAQGAQEVQAAQDRTAIPAQHAGVMAGLPFWLRPANLSA